MASINIARTLVNKRKEKRITQNDLAHHIGVSKASVSKWETGQSYPDITFLPQLAAYFNISIDDLMGYEPQMTKEDICGLYHKLSADFAAQHPLVTKRRFGKVWLMRWNTIQPWPLSQGRADLLESLSG